MFTKFRHGTIRKCIILFGNLFNNLYIDRYDESGEVLQTIKVPLAYAPIQKAIAKIRNTPQDFEQEVQITLPRMSFDISGMHHDPSRKVSTINRQRIKNDDGSYSYQYAPSPYNIGLSLYIYAKNQEDGLQIIEQILPYFNPDYHLNLKSIPEMGLVDDVPIVLTSLTVDDSFEGVLEERRMIIWHLTFEIKLNFFGPISRSGVIKRVQANLFNDKEMTEGLLRYTAEVNPFDADKTEPHVIIEKIEGFDD